MGRGGVEWAGTGCGVAPLRSRTFAFLFKKQVRYQGVKIRVSTGWVSGQDPVAGLRFSPESPS